MSNIIAMSIIATLLSATSAMKLKASGRPIPENRYRYDICIGEKTDTLITDTDT